MIASVLRLSRSECTALKIKDAYSIHRVVYALFPKIGEEARDFLYADKGGDFNTRNILLLSKRPPVPPEIGIIDSKPIPAAFLSHECYAFAVRLNPTKRDKVSGNTVAIRGSKTTGQTQRDVLAEWFTQKTLNQGFAVEKAGLIVADVGVQQFTKGGSVVTHGKATFIGKLYVTDRTLFVKSFEEGIGRAKGFGFGLLQIVPLKD